MTGIDPSLRMTSAPRYSALLEALRAAQPEVAFDASGSVGLGRDIYLHAGGGESYGDLCSLMHSLVQQMSQPQVPNTPPAPTVVLPQPAPQVPAPAQPPVAQVPATPQNVPSATVTVRSGDSLSAIAQRTLGNGNRWGEIYAANRDQISNPDFITPGMVLKLPGGATPQAPAAARPDTTPTAPAGFGGAVVEEGRKLMASGYHYPPNLTDKYYHSPNKVGCCADFVCDSNHQAGFDLGGEMKKLGMNPHYCPSMVSYYKNHQEFIPGHSGAKVGDAVFFDWDGDGTSDHVAVVSAVDGNGKPTRIVESYNFNLPVHERSMGDSLGDVMGYGRITS